jgi:mono/diheme cytochrome c family protein
MKSITICLGILLAATAAAAQPAFDRKRLKPGLIAGFTESKTLLDSTTKLRLEPTVALLIPPGTSMHPDQKATELASWAGYIQIVTPGEYTFAAVVSGGSARIVLTNDGKTYDALNAVNDLDTAKTMVGTPLTLDPGYYQFSALFTVQSANTTTRQLELQWSGPGFMREPVPWYFFSHLPEARQGQFAADHLRDRGRYLFEELACARCHTSESAFVERGGPNLSEVGKRVYPGWLDAWLADPAKLRPHTTMPKMFDDTPTGQAERYAVTMFLSGTGTLPEAKKPGEDKGDGKSLDTGKALFTSLGCAACHGAKLAGTMKATDDDDDKPVVFDPTTTVNGFGSATGAQARYDLGGIGSKTNADALARFLKSPLFVHPTGRMPDLNLSTDEARDIARHLMRYTDESITDKSRVATPSLSAEKLAETLGGAVNATAIAKLKPDEQWRSLGRAVYVNKGCANCHTLEEKGTAIPRNSAFAKLSELKSKPTSGCLSGAPKSVKYAMNDADRAAIGSFVQAFVKATPSPAYETRATLKRLNCLNCHSRDGEGGIGTELAEAMKRADSSGNEDDVAPPRLTGIGHKATAKWLSDVMLKGGRARPWMPMRMPQYGEANVGNLVTNLAACEGLRPEAPSTKPKPDAASIDVGRKLVGKEGLGCVACHDINGVAGGGTRGPDLALSDTRVKADWYFRWMHNPQRIAPGTKMPQNFTDGKSVSKLLDADADKQIHAIWQYLSLGPGLPMPSGIEPPGKGLPIIVRDRPEILRTFLPDGAGTRPIAVGFPGGTGSYAFDSHAVRLVYAWEGNFLDASPVWDKRGGNAAKLLGPKFFVPPPGPAWALTDGSVPEFDKLSEDFAFGRPVPLQMIYSGPMRVHFRGYALDAAGVPKFSYAVDSATGSTSLAIQDTPVPVRSPVGAGLRRSFVIERPATQTVWFHVGTTARKTRMLGTGIVMPSTGDKALLLTPEEIPDGATWERLPAVEGERVLLKIPPPNAATTSTVRFAVWAVPRDDDTLLQAITTR